MIKLIFKSYSRHFISRWTVLVIDVFTIMLTFALSYLIRFNFNYLLIDFHSANLQLLITSFLYLLSFLITHSYTGILRHSGLSDAIRILKATSIPLIITGVVSIYLLMIKSQIIFISPISIIIIHFLLSSFFLIGIRVIAKIVFIQFEREFTKEKIPVIIYGAGSAGMLTKNALIKDKALRYEIVAYIDENTTKTGKRLEGIPIVNPERALRENYIEQYKIQQLIIAIQQIHPTKKKKIIEKGLDLHLQVKVVPPINMWINGELSSRQLRRVKIEELLERDPIELDSKNINRELTNKIVLVTGGAGSIGSEITRQVLNYKFKRLIIIDQAESPIYNLQFEILNNNKYKGLSNRIEFVIASVRDKFRLENLFSIYRPDIIYHAAAYKHVPLMEINPYEALSVNIFGTKIIADLSVKYKVEKFVMISTDKAVNPTNIMGATKRIAEMYIQSLDVNPTKFITTRFGNVLGSNGSVVPLFRKQIESGGPITITDKKITRYFMTIPEACNLVLEAGAMGIGSDIFIFDMGSSVKIYDLARKMIKLYGYTEDDIEIVEIGLRPGEKLYEELLADKENTLPTHHPKIMRAKVVSISNKKINNYIKELSELIVETDEYDLVSKMKEIVPEYISNNSHYEKLDRKPL